MKLSKKTINKLCPRRSCSIPETQTYHPDEYYLFRELVNYNFSLLNGYYLYADDKFRKFYCKKYNIKKNIYIKQFKKLLKNDFIREEGNCYIL